MLVELTIRDFAVIAQVSIAWRRGLNVLTGETGAGKSIIVDAVGALLGDRLGSEVVRAGSQKAHVEGIFSLDAGTPAEEALRELLGAQDLWDDDEQVILSREVSRNGRSVARVNGRAVTVSLLQQVGEHLVDIHGQSQHLSLLRTREHLDYLDHFAGLLNSRQTVADLVGRWRAVQAERRALQEEIRMAARERDLLRHEVAEIEAADLEPGEDEELASTRQRLRHAERLRQAAQQSELCLQGLQDQQGAVDLLAEAASLCRDASKADKSLVPLAELLDRLAAEADEAAREIRGYRETIDSDPRHTEDIEARFLMVAELKRKYGETISAVLDYFERAKKRLATAEQGEVLLAELAERERLICQELRQSALHLSAERAQAVSSLSAAIEAALGELSLKGARFGVELRRQPDPEGIDWPMPDGSEQRVAVDSSGADRIEFLFSANPDEPPRALGRIASGGELARVSLALKAVLARVDQRPTLIFDEVDVGVGGRSASVIGQKLWELTRSHQVLCITHLPQVAAYADEHLAVTKGADGDASRTVVTSITADDRVAELSAMLGAGPASLAAAGNARELLESAMDWKSSRPVASGGV